MTEVFPPAPITVSITVLKQMFLYMDSLKVDTDEFLRSLGIDPLTVKSPDARISIETYLLIQDEAAYYTHDPYFGLHMGEFVEAGSWSILGYMMMNCKTLGEAFEKYARYSRIIGNLIETSAHFHFNRAKAVFSVPPHAPHMSRHCFESAFSSTICMMRTLTGVKLNPLEVKFTFPAPESTTEYERIFCCPVLFGQKENSMTIDIRIAGLPVIMADPGLLAYFERYAQDILADMDRKNETTHQVTRIILAHLDDEKLSIERVAKKMSVSVRTLQKHLEVEGVIFSNLLADIRERLAKRYLHENYSVEEITYLLGFSEPSVFRKAFKKWSGITPKEFREMPFSTINRV
jgi:AraC-like DNA-binding protein